MQAYTQRAISMMTTKRINTDRPVDLLDFSVPEVRNLVVGVVVGVVVVQLSYPYLWGLTDGHDNQGSFPWLTRTEMV